MPKIAPIAIAAAALWGQTPSWRRTGATKAPVVRTAAVEEPVIMPGTMIININPIERNAGFLRNLRIIHAAKPSKSPVLSAVFIKIIAVAMTSIVSR